MSEERTLTLQNLQSMIELAKAEAFRHQETITLCMSIDQKTCVMGRGNSYIIFRNQEKSAQPKPNSIIRISGYLSYGSIEFKGFGHQHTYLDIEPDGYTYNNGHFCYCPKNQSSKEADGLIINNASRTYRPNVRNHLGILLIDKNVFLSCL